MARRTTFKYRLFRASNGMAAFWRWEVYASPKGPVVESGIVYGSIAEAKERVSVAISRLSYRRLPIRS
jgi:hypothetical protein